MRVAFMTARELPRPTRPRHWPRSRWMTVRHHECAFLNGAAGGCTRTSVRIAEEDERRAGHDRGADEGNVGVLDLARSGAAHACNAPSMMCQRPWMRPVPRLPPKVLSG